MPNQNAEQIARDKIDAQLRQSGWEVQDYGKMSLSAAPAIAVREFPMEKGFGKADYLLYYKKCVIGVVEAKPEGTTLTGVEVQTEKYSVGLPKQIPAHHRPIPFLYETTGTETRFTNGLNKDAASRDVFGFHRPETLAEWLNVAGVARPSSEPLLPPGMIVPGAGEGQGRGFASAAEATRNYNPTTLLKRLRNMPPLDTKGMRDCQIEAITNLEKSLAMNKRRALIQMQTGTGKPYTTVAEAYRLIKFGGAKRILFLVDRANLAKQAKGEFDQYVTPDDGRKFTELYNVQWLQSNKIDPVAKVVITTIQRLYSMVQGEEEFDESKEEESSVSAFARFQRDPLPVVYNPNIPIETFDFVFTDECHRSIYNLWRQVLEYFDAYLIGLTATPSKQTLGFFHQNLVMDYGHAQAVRDRVNVDFDVYRIQTRITEQGETIEAGYKVDRRDRRTRKRRWEELDDDLTYTPNQLDRAVVAEDQIRTVVKAFRDRFLDEVFPERQHVPKTLIFAKDDSHADDIVRIMREEFGKGNQFCEKITYRTSTARIVDPVTKEVTYKNTGIKPEDLLSSFRNSFDPRIAVTVDMIATGTDVKPLEVVFFMRDVNSANYFEQMKGRGCRVISPTEFTAVTPDGKNKTRYIIVDAVGVTEHERKDTAPPLDQKPGVPLKTVMQAVGAGSSQPEVVSTLASRLTRIDKVIGDGVRAQIEHLAGAPMETLIERLVNATDPDIIEEVAQAASQSDPIYASYPSYESYQEAKAKELREQSLEPFLSGELRNLILVAQQDAEQTIDTVSQDEVLHAGVSAEATEKARSTITDFKKYIEENKDELDALQILYSRKRGKAPTFRQLKELAAAINMPPRSWTPEKLWHAYETLEKAKVKGHGGEMVTDLVSLVRFALQQETILAPFKETVDDRFAAWLASQTKPNDPNQPDNPNTESNSPIRHSPFTIDQMKWLHMIKDHIASSLRIESDDFDLNPFNQEGGLGRAHQLFGDELPKLLQELNEVLAA